MSTAHKAKTNTTNMPLNMVNQKFMENLEKAEAINQADEMLYEEYYNPPRYGATKNITTNTTEQQREVPFYPFTPDFPTWEGDATFSGSDYLLLNAPKAGDKTTGKDPLKDPAKPAVFLTPRVLKEVQYIVDQEKGEVAWMFLGKPIAPGSRTHLIYDYFLADQDATGAHVSLDMEDVARYTDYLKEEYPEQWENGDVAKYLHHGHSHVNMAVFWSGTDKNQQESKEELGFQNDYRFFLVFNKHKEVYASMVVYSPVFFRVDDIPVGIYTGDGTNQNHELTRQRKKELDEKLKALVKAPAPVTTVYSNVQSIHRNAHNNPFAKRTWPAYQHSYDRYRGQSKAHAFNMPNTPYSQWEDHWDNYVHPKKGTNPVGRELPGAESISMVADICMEEINSYYGSDTTEECPGVHKNYRDTVIKKVSDTEEMQELYNIGFFQEPLADDPVPAFTVEKLVGYVVDILEEAVDLHNDETSVIRPSAVDLVPEVVEGLVELMGDLDRVRQMPTLMTVVDIEDAMLRQAEANFTEGVIFTLVENSI